MIRDTVVRPDPEATCRALAEELARSVDRVLATAPRFSLVLSGGHTPATLYRQLASDFRERIPWPRVDLFWGDERAVGPEDERSNFRLARTTLLEPLGIGGAQVHRIAGEVVPSARAAADYAHDLMSYFGRSSLPARTFDFVLLGVGPDGHTASLFPGDTTTLGSHGWAASTGPAPQPPPVPRITLTLAAINGSREVAFLVCGADKQPILDSIRSGPSRGPKALPAARVRAVERLRWFLDAPAAGGGAPPALSN